MLNNKQFGIPVPKNVNQVQSGGIGHLEGDESRSATGMVPVESVKRFRVVDRTGRHAHPGISDKTIDSIAADIKSGKGITNPLMIAYDHDRKWGFLGEGHHRLEAAIKAGATHVPVSIYRQPGLGEEKRQGKGSNLSAVTDFRNPTQKELGQDYVPSNMHPYHFAQFMR